MASSPSRRFEIHQSRSPNRGSKLGTAILVVLLLGGGGSGTWFWRDRDGLVRHVRERDRLAVPAAWVLSLQTVEGVTPWAEEARAALKKSLEAGEPWLRRASARALGTARRVDVVPFLGAAAVRDEEAAVRAAAVQGLGVNGEPSARSYVEAALRDPEAEVRKAACRAVGALGLDRLIPLVIEQLYDSDTGVRRAAVEGLEAFMPDGNSFGGDADHWRRWYEAR